MNFGEVLRELLDEHDLSQKQLAEDLNISASAVGNYVRSNREPDFETLKKIAAYFRVSTDFLLNYQAEQGYTYSEHKILQLFHALTADQQELYLEQGKLLIRHNHKKKETLSLSGSDHKAV